MGVHSLRTHINETHSHSLTNVGLAVRDFSPAEAKQVNLICEQQLKMAAIKPIRTRI